MKHLRARKEVIATALEMNVSGINHGTSGNVSARVVGGFLITPSGIKYQDLKPADVVFMDLDGKIESKRKPSSEWRFHLDIYAKRKDIDAIVHTHSTHATALACLGKGIPAFHYMVAAAGGRDIRCSPYATFGTQKLSGYAVKALKDRKACLLGHHGVIATGDNLDKALGLAVEVETLAHQYLEALKVGKPKTLPKAEMDRVLKKFKSYGASAQDD